MTRPTKSRCIAASRPEAAIRSLRRAAIGSSMASSTAQPIDRHGDRRRVPRRAQRADSHEHRLDRARARRGRRAKPDAGRAGPVAPVNTSRRWGSASRLHTHSPTAAHCESCSNAATTCSLRAIVDRCSRPHRRGDPPATYALDATALAVDSRRTDATRRQVTPASRDHRTITPRASSPRGHVRDTPR